MKGIWEFVSFYNYEQVLNFSTDISIFCQLVDMIDAAPTAKIISGIENMIRRISKENKWFSTTPFVSSLSPITSIFLTPSPSLFSPPTPSHFPPHHCPPARSPYYLPAACHWGHQSWRLLSAVQWQVPLCSLRYCCCFFLHSAPSQQPAGVPSHIFRVQCFMWTVFHYFLILNVTIIINTNINVIGNSAYPINNYPIPLLIQHAWWPHPSRPGPSLSHPGCMEQLCRDVNATRSGSSELRVGGWMGDNPHWGIGGQYWHKGGASEGKGRLSVGCTKGPTQSP